MEANIFGYIGAFFVGLTLGLIGGGGSIITVPILVYILQLNPITATAYSLFVVGSTSLTGTFKNIQKRLVDFKTGFVFALPALTTVYLTRKYLLVFIPNEIFTIKHFIFTKDIAIMVFFALIMVLASVSMIRGKCVNCDNEDETIIVNYPLLFFQAIIIGLVTGLVWAGGGFLIIPALVLLAKLPMKKAVATSLFIIAINSLIGFLGDVQNLVIDWPFLLIFSTCSILGIFIGIYLNKFIPGQKLKKAFGWFVLVMGIIIFIKELNK